MGRAFPLGEDGNEESNFFRENREKPAEDYGDVGEKMSIGIVGIIAQSLMTLCIIWVLFKHNAGMTKKCEDIGKIQEEIHNILTRASRKIEVGGEVEFDFYF